MNQSIKLSTVASSRERAEQRHYNYNTKHQTCCCYYGRDDVRRRLWYKVQGTVQVLQTDSTNTPKDVVVDGRTDQKSTENEEIMRKLRIRTYRMKRRGSRKQETTDKSSQVHRIVHETTNFVILELQIYNN